MGGGEGASGKCRTCLQSSIDGRHTAADLRCSPTSTASTACPTSADDHLRRPRRRCLPPDTLNGLSSSPRTDAVEGVGEDLDAEHAAAAAADTDDAVADVDAAERRRCYCSDVYDAPSSTTSTRHARGPRHRRRRRNIADRLGARRRRLPVGHVTTTTTIAAVVRDTNTDRTTGDRAGARRRRRRSSSRRRRRL